METLHKCGHLGQNCGGQCGTGGLIPFFFFFEECMGTEIGGQLSVTQMCWFWFVVQLLYPKEPVEETFLFDFCSYIPYL